MNHQLFLLVTLAAFGCTKPEVKVTTDMTVADVIEIPKTELYSGQMDYPGIPPCHETDNDTSFGRANEATPGSTYQFLEVCPAGDVDFFHFTVDAGNCAQVYVGYGISFGDLDLAIYGADKMPTAWFDSDATHDNACVIIPPQAKTTSYYAIVAGALNKTVNRYHMTFAEEEASDGGDNCRLSCPTPPPPDMAGASNDAH